MISIAIYGYNYKIFTRDIENENQQLKDKLEAANNSLLLYQDEANKLKELIVNMDMKKQERWSVEEINIRKRR